jgi:hypothetical protein
MFGRPVIRSPNDAAAPPPSSRVERLSVNGVLLLRIASSRLKKTDTM